MMCDNCAYYVDNWFYGYQVLCASPTEYWLNPLGYVSLTILVIISLIYLIFFKYQDYKV